MPTIKELIWDGNKYVEIDAGTVDGKNAIEFEAYNPNIQAHIKATHATSNAQKNSDITKAEIEAKLTGEITSHTHEQTEEKKYSAYIETAQKNIILPSSVVDSKLSGSLKGNVLYQSVKNGDLSSGKESRWYNSYSTSSESGRVLKNIADGTKDEGRSNNTVKIKNISGAKVFLKARVKGNVSTTSISIKIQGRSSYAYLGKIEKTSGLSEYQDIFGIVTLAGGTPYEDARLLITHSYLDAATASGKSIDIDCNVGVFCIPISNTKYENSNSDTINNMILEYWEGARGSGPFKVSTDESEFYYRGSLNSTPNNKEDELSLDGNLIKRTGEYLLISEDLNIIESGTNVEKIKTSTGFLFGTANKSLWSNTAISGSLTIGGWNEKIYADDVSNINTVCTNADGSLSFIFSKGTTLEQARSELNKTNIIYELSQSVQTSLKLSNLMVKSNSLISVDNVFSDVMLYKNGISTQTKIKKVEKAIRINKDTGEETDVTQFCILTEKGFTNTKLLTTDLVWFLLRPKESGPCPALNYSYAINIIGAIGESAKSINQIDRRIDNLESRLGAGGGDDSSIMEKIGDLNNLATTNKINIVGSVNENKASISQMQLDISNIDTSWNAITGKPTAMPANGGNADTVDGKHANEFMSSAQGNGILANDIGVATQLRWKNYGQGHLIFDASGGLAPNGKAISNSTPEMSWNGSYPTIMGWNGTNTYGVKVNNTDLVQNRDLCTEVDSLKSSVVNGKQAVVNAINGSLGYASGLTTSHTHDDYAWWIQNQVATRFFSTATPKTVISTPKIDARYCGRITLGSGGMQGGPAINLYNIPVTRYSYSCFLIEFDWNLIVESGIVYIQLDPVIAGYNFVVPGGQLFSSTRQGYTGAHYWAFPPGTYTKCKFMLVNFGADQGACDIPLKFCNLIDIPGRINQSVTYTLSPTVTNLRVHEVN